MPPFEVRTKRPLYYLFPVFFQLTVPISDLLMYLYLHSQKCSLFMIFPPLP